MVRAAGHLMTETVVTEMQMEIVINSIGECTLPIAYHHIQQSAIYALIQGDLHDNGVSYEKRNYKLFTFGPFDGKYKIANKKITFIDRMKFEFRCHDVGIMEAVKDNLERNGFRLGDIVYRDIETKLSNVELPNGKIRIKMTSPICVYETDESKHTYYYSPDDERFVESVISNFERKYVATFGKNPREELAFEVLKFMDRDKYITKYKGILIEAWKGVFSLEGPSIE